MDVTGCMDSQNKSRDILARIVISSTILLTAGCAHQRSDYLSDCPTLNRPQQSSSPVSELKPSKSSRAEDSQISQSDSKSQIVNTGYGPREENNSKTDIALASGVDQQTENSDALPEPDTTLPQLPQVEPGQLDLSQVINSVYQTYPSLEAAIHQRGIALGQQISAQGAFDTKFKAASENTPVGFYETFRQSIGFVQPLYQGGEVFAGYRIGRGSFEPWYKERQTNGGGEFKTGVLVPLSRNREIDERRAELWKSSYERLIVEPEIQAQLIDSVQKASYAYWEWVAAGENYRVASDILKLANDRTSRIRSQVDSGLLDPPELTDNLRLVAEREAKLSSARQKLEKAAIKLSLYHRGIDGTPIVPDSSLLPGFPTATFIDDSQVAADSQIALQQRPELSVYTLLKRQLDVEYAEACNQLKPEVDAVLTASKDTGEPTSSKNDKGDFQLDASVFVNVPIQRRKARGKIQSIESKVSQLNAKRRLTENQIVVDVQSAYASLTNSFQQVQEAQKAVKLTEELADRERRNFDLGASDLLKVTLREQYAVESQQKAIEALLDYFTAQANYRAALAQDRFP